MIVDAFENPETLARWTSELLQQRGIDDVARWRMLEYWMQVELYKSIETGEAGQWIYLGDYEQPYYTDMPRPGSKYKTKWVDLLIVNPSIATPEKAVWIELKDTGRSEHTFKSNVEGLGKDLAALYRLRVKETKDIWLNPPPHVVDRGRKKEWDSLANTLDVKMHFISQIVIIPKTLVAQFGKEFVIDTWIGHFEKLTNMKDANHGIKIASQINGVFETFAIVTRLPEVYS